MPNHKSAIKRTRQNITRNERNTMVKSAARTAVKKARQAISAGNKDEAAKAVQEAQRVLMSSATKGVLHEKNASRRVSRLAQQLNKLA